MTKVVDLRAKTDGELAEMLGTLQREQLNLRFQRATGQLAKTSRVTEVRKDIARILTLQAERKSGKTVAAPAKKAAKKTASKTTKKSAA